MSTAVIDAPLGEALLAHLEAQLDSARRLLDIVLRQGQAIRRRDPEAVTLRISEIEAEMERRAPLDANRTALLERSGARLGIPGATVTLDALCGLLDPTVAATARELSAELRGLLTEISREHTLNRALMRQELAFLDHLLHVLGAGPQTGYGPNGPEIAKSGAESRALNLRLLDLRA